MPLEYERTQPLTMDISTIFINPHGRLRSGWRLVVFAVAFYLCATVLSGISILIPSLVLGQNQAMTVLAGNWGYVVNGFVLLVSAIGVGYACQKCFEGLPLKALGWTFHSKWFNDWLYGSLIGAVTLVFAGLIATFIGGYKFSLAGSHLLPSVGKTLLVSGLIFVFAAAGEEALFRGYPLQTLSRANLAWLGILLTSAFFAMAHLGNPNRDVSSLVKLLAFTNTALAGVWLATLYLQTRSLWLPLGAHWAWNWMMASVLGLPVSGITALTPNPLMRAQDLGPIWLTGGPYGIEGGLACTIALILSTIFVWRTRLFSASEEMKALTSSESTRQTASKDRAPVTSSAS